MVTVATRGTNREGWRSNPSLHGYDALELWSVFWLIIITAKDPPTDGLSINNNIVRCYSDFEGNGWLAYDRAFRCQMTAIKSLDWSELNSTLYNLCFVGKAKRDIVCSTCLKHNHRTSDCPDAPSSALGKISDHGLACIRNQKGG